jgi:hypothetical protein
MTTRPLTPYVARRRFTRELRLPPSPRSPRAAPHLSMVRSPERSPSRQDTPYERLFKASIRPAQDAFLRIDAQPCGLAEPARDPCSFTRPGSAPFRAPTACSPGLGRAASPPYPAPPRLASRLTLAALGRCVAPISATDKRYEHPKFRSIPEPSARAAMTASLMNTELLPNAIRTAAPDRLSPIRPQVKPRLTTRSSFGQVDLRLSSSLRV